MPRRILRQRRLPKWRPQGRTPADGWRRSRAARPCVVCLAPPRRGPCQSAARPVGGPGRVGARGPGRRTKRIRARRPGCGPRRGRADRSGERTRSIGARRPGGRTRCVRTYSPATWPGGTTDGSRASTSASGASGAAGPSSRRFARPVASTAACAITAATATAVPRWPASISHHGNLPHGGQRALPLL